MGWRDVQAGVASGAISYAPDEFKEGFARMGKNIVKRMNAHTDAKLQAKLDAEAEAAAERKELLKAQKAAEKEDQERRANTKTLIESMGHDPNNQGLFSAVFSKFKAYDDYGKTETWYQGMIDEGRFVLDAKPEQGPMPGVAVSDSIMNKYESGSGGVDALLNQSQNKTFTNIKVSKMPISEVMAFQQKRGTGSYHNWSLANMPEGTEAKEKGLGSTPVGKYQFVGDTLKDLKKLGVFEKLGITDDTIFDEETQDKLFVYYAQERMSGKKTIEEKRAALKGVWEGLRKADDEEVDQVIAQIETGVFGEEGEEVVEAERTDEMDDPFAILPVTTPGLDVTAYISAIDNVSDLTKQLALVDANAELSPQEKEEAKDTLRKYVTSLPKAKISNEDLAKLDDEELRKMGALVQADIDSNPESQQVENRKLLDRINTALSAQPDFDILDYDDVKTPTIKAEITELSKDPDGNADRITQLETLIAERVSGESINLLPGSASFITTYIDEEQKQQVTTTVLTEDGRHIDLATNTIITPTGTPINREEQRELAADFARINTSVIKPLKTARTNMLFAMQSAKKMSDIVQRNPDVQTTIGGTVPQLLKRIGMEVDAATNLLQGMNENQFSSYVDQQLDITTLEGSALDAALFQAELYKFAFSYASSELGQSGHGLSNKDFEKALQVVSAGMGTGFIINIKDKVKTIVQRADVAIDNFKENGSIRIMETLDTSKTLLSGYQRTSEQYANDTGFGEDYAWVNSETLDSPPAIPSGAIEFLKQSQTNDNFEEIKQKFEEKYGVPADQYLGESNE